MAARRERRKEDTDGRDDGREGGREEAEYRGEGWRRRAGGGVKEKGEEPSLERQPPAHKLNSRSGARSPAGSDGGGACAPIWIIFTLF